MTALLNSLFGSLSPLWEMSLTAAYVTAVVVLLRLVLKKRAPRQVLCVLWLVVFARLLVPVSLESPLSILPDDEQVQAVQDLPAKLVGVSPAAPVQNPNPAPAQNSGVTAAQTSQGGAPADADAVPVFPILSVPDGVTPNSQPQTPTGFPWQVLIVGLWLAGALAMSLYGLLSYLRLKSRLFDAIRAEDGAWEHPSVGSPFILGILRPRVYLPAGLWGMPRKFILCHERAHLRRLDHIVKPICWVALALHWFNPAVWAAFILMSKDIEAACDEAVIRQLGPRVKADYSATLLSLATNGRLPAPCPLAFDEGDAKGRIQNVLHYRRPALWIVVVSVVMAVMAAVCLLTDPVSAKEPDPDPSASDSQAQGGLNDLLDPWMLDVLNGERLFRRPFGEPADFNIHQLRSFFYDDQELPKVTVELGELAIIDLDRDGINEMVIWPTGEHEDPTEVGYYTGYLILRREGDVVKAYNPSYRAFSDLKADGTFHWSGSAFDGGIGTLSFSGTECTTNNITWFDNSLFDNNGIQGEHYFVNGLQATREEFEAAQAAQDAKPEPTWYVFEDGQLKPDPAAAPDFDNLGLSLPYFLDNEQQILYCNALITYSHLFGTSSELIDPNGYGANPVTYNGRQYYPDTGVYDSWDEFEGTILSSFTENFWNTRNKDELYVNINGTMHYLDWARGSGGYNENFPETFRLVERTDDTISFIMTGYYSDPRQFDGITDEQRESWLASGWEYSIEFPMRLVRTESGWRFDEFHNARTDNGLLEFGARTIPNPNPPAAPVPVSSAPEPSPEPTPGVTPEPAEPAALKICEHGLDHAIYDYSSGTLVIHCEQDDASYPMPAITADNWEVGIWEDFDGDGRVEHCFAQAGTMLIVDVQDGRLNTYTFDPTSLFTGFDQGRTYTLAEDATALTVSYQGQIVQVPLTPDRNLVSYPEVVTYRSGPAGSYPSAGYVFRGSYFEIGSPVDLGRVFSDSTLYIHWNIRYTGNGFQVVPNSFWFELIEN